MAMWLELIKPRFVSMLFTTSYAKWELFDKDIILIREEMFEGGTMSVPEGGNTPGRKMLLPPPCTSTVGAALIGSGLHSCSSAGFSLEEGEKKVWSFCLFFFFFINQKLAAHVLPVPVGCLAQLWVMRRRLSISARRGLQKCKRRDAFPHILPNEKWVSNLSTYHYYGWVYPCPCDLGGAMADGASQVMGRDPLP